MKFYIPIDDLKIKIMQTERWVKIGEVTLNQPWMAGLYQQYAVLEYIEKNGLRKYKRVLMACSVDYIKLNPQPEYINHP